MRLIQKLIAIIWAFSPYYLNAQNILVKEHNYFSSVDKPPDRIHFYGTLKHQSFYYQYLSVTKPTDSAGLTFLVSEENFSKNTPSAVLEKNGSATFFLIIPATQRKKKLYSAKIESQIIATSNNTVPFWMRANQYGSIPLDGISSSMIGSFSKEYDTSKRKIFDWGIGFEGRANGGSKIEGLIIAAYLKAKIGFIELKAGRTRDQMGLADETLSTGAFSISGNALGIPKVQLGAPDYTFVPFTGKILSFKGNFAFGYLDTLSIQYYRSKVTKAKTFYHQKSLYVKIGKPSWKFKLIGGVNHQVMWGDEKQMYGSAYKLTGFETLKYIVAGKAFGARGVENSKIGNHLGSVDQGLEINTKNLDFYGYHQFFFDVGALYYLANVKDGLWGLSIKNKNKSLEGFSWNKIVLEYLFSKSQAGEFDARWTPSGDENYYNNYIYAQGWTYKGQNLGTALMTAKNYGRTDLPQRKLEPIINDRVMAFHAAADGSVNNLWDYTVKLTYSRNFGTYGTSPMGNTTGGYRHIYPAPYFPNVGQFSGYLAIERPIFKAPGYKIGVAFAIDQGNMLYNSVGGLVKLSKTW